MQQRVTFFEELYDRRVGIPNLEAVVLGQTVAENALLIHVTRSVETILHPGGKVFRTMRRRGVDDACTGVHGDIVCEHAQNFAIEERVLKVKKLQPTAGEADKFMYILEAAFCSHIGS